MHMHTQNLCAGQDNKKLLYTYHLTNNWHCTHPTGRRIAGSLQVQRLCIFSKLSCPFSAQQMPVLFPKSTILALKCLPNGFPYRHTMYLCDTPSTLSFFWTVNHTYNVLCCLLISIINRTFLWSNVAKHDCADLCRACGLLNRSTTSRVTPAHSKWQISIWTSKDWTVGTI